MYKDNFVAVIKYSGKILRERNGIVYLPFGSEYSVLLKNKDARRVNVTIEVDGQDVLNGHSLVMSGNETQEIKGFMRNMSRTNRFRFIKKTKEIQEHRGDRIDDGLVRITYQFEKPPVITTTFPRRKQWEDWPDGKPGSTGDWTFWDSVTTCNSSNVRGNSALYTSCSSDSVKCYAPLSDEGITVKGEDISQQFTYGSIGQLESKVSTIVLQLRGQTATKKVKKPITVKTRLTCSTCGRRNKSTNKYCFNCGTYLL
jgi:hypothetical protein